MISKIKCINQTNYLLICVSDNILQIHYDLLSSKCPNTVNISNLGLTQTDRVKNLAISWLWWYLTYVRHICECYCSLSYMYLIRIDLLSNALYFPSRKIHQDNWINQLRHVRAQSKIIRFDYNLLIQLHHVCTKQM